MIASIFHQELGSCVSIRATGRPPAMYDPLDLSSWKVTLAINIHLRYIISSCIVKSDIRFCGNDGNDFKLSYQGTLSKMTTTTVTENISNISSILEKVSLPTDVIPTLDATIDKAPKYTKVPGGFEVEHKGYKWFTGTIPNPDYVPPKDFTYPPNYDELPLNPDGQIELPQKLVADYTDVSLSRSPTWSESDFETSMNSSTS